MQLPEFAPLGAKGIPLVRPAVESDIEGIIRVQEQAIMVLGLRTYGRRLCEAWARVGTQHTDGILEQGEFFVADGPDGLSGVSGWSPDLERRDVAWIRYVFVHPHASGFGLGRSLVRTAEESAREAGCRRLLLWSSLNAVGFYRKLAYRRIRRALWPVETGLEIEYVLMSKRA